MNTRRTLLAVSLAATLTAPLASADTPVERSDDARASMSSGIGAPVVPVSFRFATREEGHDVLLTDVHVVVLCPVSGRLFEAVSDGPFLTANLPRGRYEVIASHDGRAKHVALDTARGDAAVVVIDW